MTACRDCLAEGITTSRPVVQAGRCATHHRRVTAARKLAAHDKMVQRVYGLEPGDYDRLYEAQGGVCGGCGPWSGRSGKTKKLAVDHDHQSGEVRGLLCSDCNRGIGRYRDNPEIFDNLAEYLRNPPARKVLKRE